MGAITDLFFWVVAVARDVKLKVDRGLHSKSFYLTDTKPQEQGRKISTVFSALPETAASVAIAATVVGAAATLLVRKTKGSEATEVCHSFMHVLIYNVPLDR